MCPKRVVL